MLPTTLYNIFKLAKTFLHGKHNYRVLRFNHIRTLRKNNFSASVNADNLKISLQIKAHNRNIRNP